jgi:Leucine-rich repeat (LRR) protein
MAKTADEAYREAEEKIAIALREGWTSLDLGSESDEATKLTKVPESIRRLTRLRALNRSRNELTELPESLGQLTLLKS